MIEVEVSVEISNEIDVAVDVDPQIDVAVDFANIEIIVSRFRKIAVTSGEVDGVNTVFVLEKEADFVWKNGQLLTEDHPAGYTKEGLTITFAVAPFFISEGNPDNDQLTFGGNVIEE